MYRQGRKVGRAVPQVIGRHAHPKAPPDEDPAPRRSTASAYLQLVADADAAALGGSSRTSPPSTTATTPPAGPAAKTGRRGGGERRGPARRAAGLPAV